MKIIFAIFITMLSINCFSQYGLGSTYDEYNDRTMVFFDAEENNDAIGRFRFLCLSDIKDPWIHINSKNNLNVYGANFDPVEFTIDAGETIFITAKHPTQYSRVVYASAELVRQLKAGKQLKIKITGRGNVFEYTFDLINSDYYINRVLTRCSK